MSVGRSFAIRGLALAPIAIFVWVHHTVSEPLQQDAHLIHLNGVWQALETDELSTPPAESDPRWKPFRVPGGYTLQGFRSPDAWLHKDVEVPEALAGRELMLLLGDTRSGTGRLFVNGQFLGTTQKTAGGIKAELSGTDAWVIPVGILHAGNNRIDLGFHWGHLGQDGIVDARAFLGTRAVLEPFYRASEGLRRFVQHGAIAVMAFMMIFLGVVLYAEEVAERRRLYVCSLKLLGASLIYLLFNTGLAPGLATDSPIYFPMMYAAVMGLSYVFPEWAGAYSGVRSVFSEYGRYFIAVMAVVFLVVGATAGVRYLVVPYAVLSLYALAIIGHTVGLGLQWWLRGDSLPQALIGGAVVVIAFSGGFDLLRDLGLITGPRLFPIGLSFLTVTAGAVVAADVLRIAARGRELNRALQASNAQLELSNQSLRVALGKTEEASRLKTEFLATMSHELRTPLNTIINLPAGMLERMATIRVAACGSCHRGFELEGSELVSASTACPGCQGVGTLAVREEKQFRGEGTLLADSLERVQQQGVHMAALVEDVLMLRALEAGNARAHRQRVPIEGLLDEAIRRFEPLAQEAGIQIRKEVPSASSISGDGSMLSQVMRHLLANAIKFSTRGTEVVVAVEGGSAGATVVTVRDQGIGIAAEHHEAIFESFRQVDGSHTRKFGGAGLGLSICKKIVALHGGTISVESAPGRGSTFRLSFPG